MRGTTWMYGVLRTMHARTEGVTSETNYIICCPEGWCMHAYVSHFPVILKNSENIEHSGEKKENSGKKMKMLIFLKMIFLGKMEIFEKWKQNSEKNEHFHFKMKIYKFG